MRKRKKNLLFCVVGKNIRTLKFNFSKFKIQTEEYSIFLNKYHTENQSQIPMIGCRGNMYSNISKINVLVFKRNFAGNLKDYL